MQVTRVGSQPSRHSSHELLDASMADLVRSPSKKAAFWLAWSLAIFSIIKLILVANQETFGFEAPHDQLWHILAADHWVWGRPYSSYALAHLPTFALSIALVEATGIPLRIAMEMGLLGAAAYVSLSLGRLGVPPWLQATSFCFIAFHPQTFLFWDHTLAEPYAAVLSLLMVGAFIFVLTRPTLFHSAMFALAFALLWHTRRESAPIMALFGAVLAAGALWAWWRGKESKRSVLVLVVLPVIATVTWGGFLAIMNRVHFGIYATTDFSEANFARAYKALQSIAVQHPQRFVPIPIEARTRAYAVSPAFSEIKPYLDGAVENWGATFSREAGIEGGEIGAGWFHWSLRGAVEAAGYYKDAKQTSEFYRRVARQLEAAFESGALPKRMHLLSFIDPELSVWVPHLLTSIIQVTMLLDPPMELSSPQETAGPSLAAIDRTTNRRAAVRTSFAGDDFRTVTKRHIARWYKLAAAPFCFLALAAVVTRGTRFSFATYAALACIGLLVAARIGLFAIIDASAWNALQPRYMLPATLLVVLIPVLVLGAARSVRPAWPRKRAAGVMRCEKAAE